MVIVGKYELIPSEEQLVALPIDAEIKSVIVQNDKIVFYAIINIDKAKNNMYKFWIMGTGWNLKEYKVSEDATFLGTVQINGFVWHIFYKHLGYKME